MSQPNQVADLQAIADAIAYLMADPDKKAATIFLPPLSDSKWRVRATRTCKNKRDFRLTIGWPNYRERKFLKLCKKAGTKPRRAWFQEFPKSRRKRA